MAERGRIVRSMVLAGGALLVGLGLVLRAAGGDIEGAPIHYATAPTDNAVSRLQRRIDAGELALAFDPERGYLPALLKELSVPSSSQVLVFSKTSLQRHRISPRTPRALYFSDDTYVGYCQKGDVLEVTAVDPNLGAVFYSLAQRKAERPQLKRQADSCMLCHGSSQNQGLPSHLVRSVYADRGGFPVLSMGTHRIDHRSPLAERWGGWYVTGTSGQQTHLGNLCVRDERQPEEVENRAGVNVTDLASRLDTSAYLTGHSDIVALMVLEHQAEGQNLLTRAGMQTRQALYEEAEINKALGRPAGERSESTQRRIRSACEPLVKYLLFSGETRLTDEVRGTSGFAEEFAKQGPFDRRGRSLRQLDLRRRLFTYPCSYLIYSRQLDALPGPAHDYVLARLGEVLTGKDQGADFAHLTPADRQAVRAIVRATKSGLPASWGAK